MHVCLATWLRTAAESRYSAVLHMRAQALDLYTFQIVLDGFYYPALQDLTLIRPVRFISPLNLHASDKMKSCPITTLPAWPTNIGPGERFT